MSTGTNYFIGKDESGFTYGFNASLLAYVFIHAGNASTKLVSFAPCNLHSYITKKVPMGIDRKNVKRCLSKKKL